MTPDNLRDLVVESLDDLKGQNILALDVSGVSSVTDFMVMASGTSNRHVRSLVQHVVERARASGCEPMGIEGQGSSDWVLVDLGDVVVHVMQEETRSFYDLERLWKSAPSPELTVGTPTL